MIEINYGKQNRRLLRSESSLSLVLRIFFFLFFPFAIFGETSMSPYLEKTRYIDHDSSEIIDTKEKIVSGLLHPKDKAIAIHNFVRDEIAFGFSSAFWNQKASQVLKEKRGFCNTKSTLFIAMLRSAGIPAKQVFVDIKSEILFGFIDPGSGYVDHSYVEVYLNHGWIKVDSFIVDKKLHNSALKKLNQLERNIGFGTVVGATSDWDGNSDSFSQYLPERVANLSKQTYGVYQDVGDFYAKNSNAINGGIINRLLFHFFASGANERIETLRMQN